MMRIKMTGYIHTVGCPKFEDTFVAMDVQGIHDLLDLLSKDKVVVSEMQDVDTGVYYFTGAQVEAMGHDRGVSGDPDIWCYTSDEFGRLTFRNLMKA